MVEGLEQAKWKAQLKELDTNSCPSCGQKMLYSTEHWSWRYCKNCNKKYRRTPDKFILLDEY